MKSKAFIIWAFCLLLSFSFLQCKKSDKSNLYDLQQQVQPQEQQTGRPQLRDLVIPPAIENDVLLSETAIHEKIASIVNNYKVRELSKIDFSPTVVAHTEFNEIESVQYTIGNHICEVKFSFFIVPLELEDGSSIESDGMIFEISKQFQKGIATWEYSNQKWQLVSLINEFRQFDFLADTDRR
jgi:hypothetical protein